MLGKLIKYEFKESWQPMVIVFGLLLGVALIDGIAMRIGSRIELFADVMAVIFVLLIGVAGVLVVVWTVKRFYDNLLSDQGYMTMTLPASAAEQVGAKLIVSLVWILAYAAAVLLSLGLLFVASGGYAEVVRQGISSDFQQFQTSVAQYHLWVSFWLYLVSAVVSLAETILTVYFAMAVGQLVHRHRGLLSVATWIAIFVVEQICSFRIMYTMFGNMNTIVSTTDFSKVVAAFNQFGVIGLVITLAVGAIWFIGTSWILDRHLNLE
ncbi:hypothetical protein [Pseudoramibacter porci]|uniref:Uncharacterized protein n=1 Tax=Pseudoramibacter porci TaxID=2606631 RepID=A0A7X2NES0_9FIRM|nr:hypothetical protein [Pseudoramibacter porci]MSS19276.1 hypothetical protein [Pseudoramibacter porci]